jgi:hypothetical protein
VGDGHGAGFQKSHGTMSAMVYHPHRLVLANAVDETVMLYSSEAATRQDVAGR